MSHAAIIVALDEPGDIEAQITEQMAPFDESGEWFKKGTRWDWWTIGGRFAHLLCGKSQCLRNELNEAEMAAWNRSEAQEAWESFQAETHKGMRAFYNFAPDETLESLIAKRQNRRISAYAFLWKKRWHENQRMGFFGCATASECKIEGRDKGKCIVGRISKPPCIIGFNEPDERWRDHYWSRFIENLPAETTLVVVDFHV